MAIDPNAVGATAGPVERSWTSTDCLLYAVGVGAGLDELQFSTEKDQRVLPTMPVVLTPRGAVPMSKIGTFDPAMLVHGEQSIELARPLPVEGKLRASGRIAAVYDKGKAAVVVVENRGGGRGERGAAVPDSFFELHPRGGRLRRTTRSVGAVSGAPGAKAGSRGHLRDPAGAGPPVSPERRPQSAPQRSGVRKESRLPKAHSSRPVHVRLHRSGASAHAVRLRPSPVQVDVRPFLAPGVPWRGAHSLDVGRRPHVHIPDAQSRRRNRSRPWRHGVCLTVVKQAEPAMRTRGVGPCPARTHSIARAGTWQAE